MARGGRNQIRRSAGGQPVWTDEQRQVLRLSYQLWQLDDHQVNTILHRVYPNLTSDGRSYQFDHTRDEYRYRFRTGRSKRWHDIDRPNRHNRAPYTQEELDDQHRIQLMIETAAAGGPGEVAIQLAPRDDAPFPMPNVNVGQAAPAIGGTVVEDDGEAESADEGNSSPRNVAEGRPMDEMNGEDDEQDGQADSDDLHSNASPTTGASAERDAEADAPEAEMPAPAAGDAPSSGLQSKKRKAEGERPTTDDRASSGMVPSKKKARMDTQLEVTGITSTEDQTGTNNGIDTSPDPRIDAPDQPKMDMYHFRNLTWNPNGDVEHRWKVMEAIDKQSDLYSKGGSVQLVKYFYRFNNEEKHMYKHIMICDASICKVCSAKPGNLDDVPPSHDRPYVHRGKTGHVQSFDEKKKVHVLKKNGLRLYDTEHHDQWESGMIEFESGWNYPKIRSAYLCKPDTCPSCSKHPVGLYDPQIAARMGKIEQKKYKAS